MDYYVLQVAGLQGASEPTPGIGSADVVRVWEPAESQYDYLAVRGDTIDDAVAVGRDCGLDVVSAGQIVVDGVADPANAPSLEGTLPTYLLSGAVDLFDNDFLASVGPSFAWCIECKTFHREGQHTQWGQTSS
jgi:hypothetical protein